jgi:hypothetical protein
MIFHYIILSLIILVLLIISLHGFYPGLCMIFHYILSYLPFNFQHHACDLVFWFTLLKGSIMEQIITSPGPKKTQAIVEEDSRYLPIQWAQ